MTCHHSDPIFNCESCAPAPGQPGRVALRGISLGIRQTLWYGTEPPRKALLWAGTLTLELLMLVGEFGGVLVTLALFAVALVLFPELAMWVAHTVGYLAGTIAESIRIVSEAR